MVFIRGEKNTNAAEPRIESSEWKEILHVEKNKCPKQQSDKRSPQPLDQVSDAGQNYTCYQNRGIARGGVKIQERLDFFPQQSPGYDRVF